MQKSRHIFTPAFATCVGIPPILPSITHCSQCFLRSRPIAVPSNLDGTPAIFPITLDEIDALSSVRIYIPKDLRTQESRGLGIKVGATPIA
jgi:hypothetical protein